MVSSPFMQRSSVLLPEPLRPMIATIWPCLTSSETPSSTFIGPKYLVTSRTCTISPVAGAPPPFVAALFCDMQSPFENAARDRQRIADREIDRRNDDEDEEGLEGGVVDALAGARQLDETDHRGERGVLHHLHHESDRRRRCDAHRLRQNHIDILIEAVEPE